jgi:metal-sulfur cluster biosynthetic enzyme
MDIFSNANNIEIEAYNALKKVIDPELGINIIDLGLVYEIKYSETEGLKILMTLSSQGCPMGDVIKENMETVLTEKFPQYKHHIELTWEPKWNTGFVTQAGRKELGLI